MASDALWQFVDANGMTANTIETAAAWFCLDEAEKLRGIVGVGQSVSGTIVFDVPTPTGALLLTPAYSGLIVSPGWEWAIG